MARLRAPDGCPWDREQTFDTIKRHTLEETYEVFDAIERRAWPELKDELGDLLLQVLFYAQMASEAGYFTISDVAANLNAKLIRRHPHIFAGVEATDADAVLRNWEQIKRAEKQSSGTTHDSMLDDIPRTMPAMLEAGKLGSKAAKIGFDWPNVDGLFDKLQEEIAELQAELAPAARKFYSCGGRTGRSFVYRSQPCPASQDRSRVCSACIERQVSPALPCDGVRSGRQRRSGGPHSGGAGRSMEPGEERRQRVANLMNVHPKDNTSIEIRPLTTLEHFERCVVLQLEVWGYSDGDIVPRRVFSSPSASAAR